MNHPWVDVLTFDFDYRWFIYATLLSLVRYNSYLSWVDAFFFLVDSEWICASLWGLPLLLKNESINSMRGKVVLHICTWGKNWRHFQNLRSSKCYSWRFKISGAWCLVNWQIITDISEGLASFMFRVLVIFFNSLGYDDGENNLLRNVGIYRLTLQESSWNL